MSMLLVLYVLLSIVSCSVAVRAIVVMFNYN